MNTSKTDNKKKHSTTANGDIFLEPSIVNATETDKLLKAEGKTPKNSRDDRNPHWAILFIIIPLCIVIVGSITGPILKELIYPQERPELIPQYIFIKSISYNDLLSDGGAVLRQANEKVSLIETEVMQFIREHPDKQFSLGLLVLTNEGERAAENIVINCSISYSDKYLKESVAELEQLDDDLSAYLVNTNTSSSSRISHGSLRKGEAVNIPIYLSLSNEKQRLFMEYTTLSIDYKDSRSKKTYSEDIRKEFPYSPIFISYKYEGGIGGGSEDLQSVLHSIEETVNVTYRDLLSDELNHYGAYNGVSFQYNGYRLDLIEINYGKQLDNILEQGCITTLDGKQEPVQILGSTGFSHILLVGHSNIPSNDKFWYAHN
jgi:hypothetical protein